LKKESIKINHENTKSKKHEMFRNIFVFSLFRDFVMEVFDSSLDPPEADKCLLAFGELDVGNWMLIIGI